ncbi:MAG: hypothetical protein K2K24_04395 [Clostridia bacterium]|nr:hypothetical protein [Clostridia bacterium]
MKKKIAVIILTVILLTTCLAMFCACKDKDPREVEIEIINPLTGELFVQDEVLDLPTEQTPIEVRVKDKNKGKYLTDKNLPKTTVKESLNIRVSRLWKNDYKELLNTNGYLPIEEENVVMSNYYEIEITFDCKPTDIEDDDYKRKYEVKTASVCFYSNKEWKGADYFELAFAEWSYDDGYWEYDTPPTTIEEIEEWLDSYVDIWGIAPDLREKVDTLEELNALRSNKDYPFFNEKYAKNKIYKTMQRLDEFDEKYFNDKSLILIMQRWSLAWGDLRKMSIEDRKLTITFVLPKGVIYPDVVAVRVSVIEIKKQVIKDVEQIQDEVILEQ